jgi:catechol 2,3-dioxygenase-like lactoylglutathione lyase family enzyme
MSESFKTAVTGVSYGGRMTPRFDMIGLVVADLSASLEFYRRLGLDIPETPADSPHAEITLPNGLRIAWDPVSTIQSFDDGWAPPSGSHRVGLAFRCDSPADVDKTYESITAAGHPGHKAPWDAFWGQRYAMLLDPDGNSVELFADLPGAGA